MGLRLLSGFNDLTERPVHGPDGRSCCLIILHLFAFYTLRMDDQGAAAVAEDFRRARRRAQVQRVLARLAGKDDRLLAYDDVRRKLHGVESAAVTRQQIPLDSIVGSVGRHQDFDRSFAPLQDSDLARWGKVKQAVTGLGGVPPIEVYKLGGAYFVRDGNHRVSVARQLGAQSIEAYVTEVNAPVLMDPDDTPESLIIKAEYADFLERTQLRKLRPGADMRVTIPGQYEKLLEHIAVHQNVMSRDEDRDVSYEEAVVHGYDHLYLPAIALLREYGLMEDYSDLTPTDLYLWLADYRADMERELAWTLTPRSVAHALREVRGPARRDTSARNRNPRDQLVRSVLVAIDGSEAGWRALDQALLIGRLEQAHVYGLHVVAKPDQVRQVEVISRTFARRCGEAGVAGELAFESGDVVSTIAGRCRWSDVLVAPLSHPPQRINLGLYGGFHTLLRRCPRPILAVPDRPSAFERLLLGYNGTPKSTIALFAAAYLAGRRNVALKVVTVQEDGKTSEKLLAQARSYLDRHEIEADYGVRKGPIVSSLLDEVDAHRADLLLVGSYEYPSLLEPVFGGVLDELLRRCRVPVLIGQ